MAALPKRRISTRRKGKRRAELKNRAQVVNVIKCAHCSQPKRPHFICPNCKKY